VTSVTCGLLLVFLFPGSSTASTAKHTFNPIIELSLGVLVLLIVVRVGRGRDRRRRAWRDRRREKAKDKPPPRWKRVMSKGSARDMFVVGMLLSFPGASYIAGMDALHKQRIGTFATALAVIAFSLIMLLLVEHAGRSGCSADSTQTARLGLVLEAVHLRQPGQRRVIERTAGMEAHVIPAAQRARPDRPACPSRSRAQNRSARFGRTTARPHP
jgi:Sap, sulfolipid-1-addressing protein